MKGLLLALAALAVCGLPQVIEGATYSLNLPAAQRFFLLPGFSANEYFLDVFCVDIMDTETQHTLKFYRNATWPLNVTGVPDTAYCRARIEGMESTGRRSYWFSTGFEQFNNHMPNTFVPEWCSCQIVSHARVSSDDNRFRITLDINQGQFNDATRAQWPYVFVQYRLSGNSWNNMTVANLATRTNVTINGSGPGVYEFRFQFLNDSAGVDQSLFTLIETTPLTTIRNVQVTVPAFVYTAFNASRYYVDFFCINKTGQVEPQVYQSYETTNTSIRTFSFTAQEDAFCFSRVDGLEASGRRTYFFGAGVAAGLARPTFIPTWCACTIVTINRVGTTNLSQIIVDLNNGGQNQTSQFTAQTRTAWPTFRVQWRLRGTTAWTNATLQNTATAHNFTLTAANNTDSFQPGVYQIRYQMLSASNASSVFSLIENIPVTSAAVTNTPSSGAEGVSHNLCSVALFTALLSVALAALF